MQGQRVDPPQRFSERLARSKSIGSTLRRTVEPGAVGTYVPQWPVSEVPATSSRCTVVSMADPDSPEPPSPDAEEVEAEVLAESCELLSVMRSLDPPVFAYTPGHSIEQDSQATVDVENTQIHLEFSAPASEVGSEPPHLPRSGIGLATPDAIEVGSDSVC